MSGIFISYRRDDADDSARALYESLRPHFGEDRLFIDVEAIALGVEFPTAIEHALSGCGVFLVVIGPGWLDIKAPTDPSGPRRLDNPNDVVRQEIAAALKKGLSLPVIPVLVRGATMPAEDQLPEDLKGLAFRQGLTLTNRDWQGTVQRLVKTITPLVEKAGQSRVAHSVEKHELSNWRLVFFGTRRYFFIFGTATALVLGTALLIGPRIWTSLFTPAVPAVVQKGAFTPPCTLPFNGVRNPASDDHCGIEGDGTDTADRQEATAKNNFCASTTHPTDITYYELIDLQSQAAQLQIPKKVDDRKDIENMGEGNYVSYVALIMDAHYSDTTSGEAVNCNLAGNAANDIAIVLMADPNGKDECHSTTAEMSPHYRPAGWTPQRLNSLQKPVRIRGQLFYDNSHAVCGKTKPNPKRASLWEIHPVYSIDACKSSDLDQCRKAIDDDSQWTPIT